MPSALSSLQVARTGPNQSTGLFQIEMGACYRKNTRNIFVLKTLACDLIRMKKMRKNNTVILSNCHPNMCDSGKDNERRASRAKAQEKRVILSNCSYFELTNMVLILDLTLAQL